MDDMTWNELRKILVDAGDSPAMNGAVKINNGDGCWFLELAVLAREGGFVFLLAENAGE